MNNLIEKILNLSVGTVLLTNLYYLSGVLGIPYQLVIVLCLLISLGFSIKHYSTSLFVNLINNWHGLFFILFSLVFSFIDILIYKTEFRPNDIIRVIWYCSYFIWTFGLFGQRDKVGNWVFIQGGLVLFMLMVLGLFEKENPIPFSIILPVEKRNMSRIAATLVDANAYAGLFVLIIMMFFKHIHLKNKWFENGLFAIALVVFLYFNEASGSRQGLLMAAIWVIFRYKHKLTIRNSIVIALFFAFMGLLVFINLPSIKLYSVENPSSSVSRLFNSKENERAQESNFYRNQSIVNGFELIKNNLFVYGPGAFNFISRWEKENYNVEPHNGFLFLLAQYGLWAVFLFWFMWISAKRALAGNNLDLYLAYLLHFALMPNTMYYATAFLVFYYIDILYISPKITVDDSRWKAIEGS